MERDLTPEEIEKHNNRKLTADKIQIGRASCRERV